MDGQRKNQPDPERLLKRNYTNNYRLITCLPMVGKILMAQIREEIFYSLISRKLFPKEQKGSYKGRSETGDLLYIDQHIFKESKTRRKNVAMVSID